MVDPGENVSATLKREFGEESLGALDMPAEKRAEVEKKLDQLFKGGEEVRVFDSDCFSSGEIVSLFHRDTIFVIVLALWNEHSYVWRLILCLNWLLVILYRPVRS